jgi:manganese-dependent ADP-ribose/CDP-alcohol diphosphatase
MSTPLPRRRFLRQLALGVAAAPFVGCASRSEGFEVGIIADPQYADIPDRGTRAYRASIAKLGAAVEHFNGRPLDFCVNLGDTIDREWRSFDEIMKPMSACRHAWHHVLGNHDFSLSDAEKAKVDARLGVAARHRFFDRPGFRFVILDTGAVSTYATREGDAERAVAAGELARAKARGLPQAQDWNGAVGPRQLAWFERVAAEASAKRLKVVVCAHHPVAPAGAHDAWDAAEVLAVLGRHRNIVAWFNGHNHAGGFAVADGLPCVTFHGMVETPDTNAFATARFLPDRIILAGHGREPSRELIFRA